MLPSTRAALEWGSLVCLGVPLATEVGVDLLVFAAGARFGGIKLIPPGLHLLYSAAREGGVRSASWLHVPRGGSVHVARWDAREEALRITHFRKGDRGDDDGDGGDAVGAGSGGSGDEEAVRFAAAAARLELDATLGAYPLDAHARWCGLCSHLTPRIVRLLAPQGGLLFADAPPAVAAEVARGLAAEATATSEGDPPPHTPSPPAFTRIPGVGLGAAPRDRTSYAMDTSDALARTLGAAGAALSDAPLPPPPLSRAEAFLLGELQAAFLWFLCGQSYAGWEQWKHLADALCRAEDALTMPPPLPPPLSSSPPPSAAFFEAALGDVLAKQLLELPPDFFASHLSRDNFLAAASLPALARVLRMRTPAAGAPLASSGVRAAARAVVRAASSRMEGGVDGGDGARLLALLEEEGGGSGAVGSGDGSFASMAELLKALEADAEGGDPPVVVE